MSGGLKKVSRRSPCHTRNFDNLLNAAKLFFILLQSTHLSSVQLSATKLHIYLLLSQKHDDEKVPPSPDRLSIPVLNVLKCCQSVHISSARQANRINPGLTLQARVQGNGLG